MQKNILSKLLSMIQSTPQCIYQTLFFHILSSRRWKIVFVFSKYRYKLKNLCWNFPDTMVFDHCQKIHEQQRQSEVPRCRKNLKAVSDSETACSKQKSLPVYKDSIAKRRIWTLWEHFINKTLTTDMTENNLFQPGKPKSTRKN